MAQPDVLEFEPRHEFHEADFSIIVEVSSFEVSFVNVENRAVKFEILSKRVILLVVFFAIAFPLLCLTFRLLILLATIFALLFRLFLLLTLVLLFVFRILFLLITALLGFALVLLLIIAALL